MLFFVRKHEWDKHGTCALGSPFVSDESDYFNITLGLRSHFDLAQILKASNVVPDDQNDYELDKIKYALSSVLSVPSYISCQVPKNADYQYLSSIQICLDLNFDITECGGGGSVSSRAGEETQCRENLPVRYPTIRYHR